ncbi:MAG: ROK family protein [Verrucomicrobiota bacterium]
MFLGIEIGGTKLQLVRGTARGEILDRRRFEVDRAAGAAGIRARIESALPELTGAGGVRGIGVGFGGPVDWREGRICCSHQVEGWSGFDLEGWLEGMTRVPISIDNDANVAALGEAYCGAGAKFNPVFYVTLGSGVGGGLIVNGAIYHGAPPGESEIGLLRIDRAGTLLESRCSGWAVDAKVRAAAAGNPRSVLAGKVGLSDGTGSRSLAAAIQEGDPVARRILEETAADLAYGLSHVVHLLHPEILILGGGLSMVGEPLRAAVEGGIGQWLSEAYRPAPRVLLSGLGEDAVPVGALLLAAQR